MDRADRGVATLLPPTVSLCISSEGSLPGAQSRPRSGYIGAIFGRLPARPPGCSSRTRSGAGGCRPSRSRACLTCYSRDILTCTSPNQEAQATRATTGREHHSSPLPHFPDRQLSAGDGAAEPGRRQRLHLTRARGHDSIGHSSSSICPLSGVGSPRSRFRRVLGTTRSPI